MNNPQPGHASGHEPRLGGFTWAELLGLLRDQYGTWTELAARVRERAPKSADLPSEESLEKGLKRLAKRGNKPGETYGDLVLRYLGVPASLSLWIRGLTQYHSRFADLPIEVRRVQLVRYDCPPISESRDSRWVHLAMASLAHRRGAFDEAAQRLALSRGSHDDHALAIERALLEARMASDRRDLPGEEEAIAEAETALAHAQLSDEDRHCYHARLADQRAYRMARERSPEAIEQALAEYQSIEGADIPPFARFRREHGRAWCLWKLGRHGDAIDAAELAMRHAGDGGFVRFRVLAMDLSIIILGPGQRSDELRARARAMAEALGDPDLLARVSARPT